MPDIIFKNVRAVVMDVEGTTGSIRFVKGVLFPFAAENLPGFIQANATRADVAEQLAIIRKAQKNDALTIEEITQILLQWIKDDVKTEPLKTLQGLVWEDGYKKDVYDGHVYPDAAEKITAWHAAGLPLYVFSSGSNFAQYLIFKYSDQGDLSDKFNGHFDLSILPNAPENAKPKNMVEAYHNIQHELDLPPATILFLSDIPAELAAADEAGWQTLLLARPGDVKEDAEWPRSVTNFHDIQIEGYTHAPAPQPRAHSAARL